MKMINWMGGWPKDGLVSGTDWEERLAAAAERYRGDSSPESGPDRLRELLAHGLLRQKTEGEATRLRLTPGADAALTALATLSLSPGDVVLTENLTSRSALKIFRKAGVRVEAVDGDRRGMDPEALQAAIGLHSPRWVYASPSCTDPEGAVWSEERKFAVTEICRKAGVLLVLDDRQEMLVYDGDNQSANSDITMDSVQKGVLSVGQLPPGLIAGLRFGWVAGMADELERRIPEAADSAELADANLSPLDRQALADLISEQPLEPLLELFRVQCGNRMRELCGHLTRRRIEGLNWRRPKGGLHLWLTLPDGLDGETLLRGAWLKGVMFQPGSPFYVSRPMRNTLRLTFAYADERQMKAGVSRLVEAMGDFLGRFDIG